MTHPSQKEKGKQSNRKVGKEYEQVSHKKRNISITYLTGKH